MAWFHEDNNSTLNFMVIGHTCSGYGLVQSALNAHSRIVCHGDLLHDNVKIRKCEHEKYFGDSGKLPDWFINTHISVEQYLNNKTKYTICNIKSKSSHKKIYNCKQK